MCPSAVSQLFAWSPHPFSSRSAPIVIRLSPWPTITHFANAPNAVQHAAHSCSSTPTTGSFAVWVPRVHWVRNSASVGTAERNHGRSLTALKASIFNPRFLLSMEDRA